MSAQETTMLIEPGQSLALVAGGIESVGGSGGHKGPATLDIAEHARIASGGDRLFLYFGRPAGWHIRVSAASDGRLLVCFRQGDEQPSCHRCACGHGEPESLPSQAGMSEAQHLEPHAGLPIDVPGGVNESGDPVSQFKLFGDARLKLVSRARECADRVVDAVGIHPQLYRRLTRLLKSNGSRSSSVIDGGGDA